MKAQRPRLRGGEDIAGSMDMQSLDLLVSSFESKPDKTFLKKIVRDAAEVIGADLALISRLNGSANRMHALEVYDRNEIISEYIYDLHGTPCEAVVIEGNACCFPKGVQQLFPEDTDLVDLDFEGYVGVPLFSSDGRVMGLFCTLFKEEVANPDFVITTLKFFSARIAAEIERSEAEERTKLALEGGRAGIWDWDVESDDVYITPEFALRLGMDPAKPISNGAGLLSVTHPEDRNFVRRAFYEQITNDVGIDCRCRVKIAEKDYRWIQLAGHAIRDADGRAVRLSGTMSDIDDLVRAQLEAQAANESKSAFLANMSHEIRTPMNAIMGMLQVLSGSNVDAEQRDWIDTAYGAADSLLMVLNDILDLSRLEAGKMEVQKEPFEISSFLSEFENVFRTSASKKGLGFETCIESNVPARFCTDASRLRQILANFVSNSIKFADRGNIKVQVAVTSAHGFDSLEFSVLDKGIGIPEKSQSKLFDRFEQADMSTTRQFGGTGLGLAICRELSGLLGGIVGLESTEGEGSRFWVALPLDIAVKHKSPSPKQSNPSDQTSFEDKPLAGIRALVAEDNIVNQRILTLLLAAFGAESAAVATGDEALERVQQEAFDLVLMDVTMPGMSGYEAAQAIRELQGQVSQIPIIAVTAHAMTGESDKALKAGMNGYVPKPIATDILVDAILAAVGKR